MNRHLKVDLHMHSNASDGLYSPRKVMKIAFDAGLAAAGLTDHDTVSGLPEAELAANAYGLELVPGVELSVFESDREIHILGYYPRDADRLNRALEDIREERFNRMDRIVEKLQGLRFNIKLEEVLAEAGDSAPGRLHLARLMLRKKYVHTLDEAFSLYLNPNRGAFVPRRLMTLKRAMNLLKAVEAIPVIAHPGTLGRPIIDKLAPLGLRGIEVFHPDHSPSQVEFYKKIAREERLLITGGSDFHGDREIGTAYAHHLAIPGHYLDEIKKLRDQKEA